MASSRSVPASSQRVTVSGIPVRRFLQLHDHLDALVAELALVAASPARAPKLRELLPLLAGLTGPFSAVRLETKRAAREARARGKRDFSLSAELPKVDVAAAVDVWNGLMDAADSASSQGMLLTLPAPPDVVELRRWIGKEIATAAPQP